MSMPGTLAVLASQLSSSLHTSVVFFATAARDERLVEAATAGTDALRFIWLGDERMECMEDICDTSTGALECGEVGASTG